MAKHLLDDSFFCYIAFSVLSFISFQMNPNFIAWVYIWIMVMGILFVYFQGMAFCGVGQNNKIIQLA